MAILTAHVDQPSTFVDLIFLFVYCYFYLF